LHQNRKVLRAHAGALKRRSQTNTEPESLEELLERAAQYAEARMAPGIVLPGAYSTAFASLSALPAVGTPWTEETTRPYNSDDSRYRDPNFSNSSGGAGIVAGRMTGLAVGGGYIYAGVADGGVFRSGDNGVTWTPLTDGLATLSVGDLRLAPDGALWLATGEANTGSTSYVGSGVYRLANPQSGVFTTGGRVGGPELESTTIGKLRFDTLGSVYAATSRGIWKHSNTTSALAPGLACRTRCLIHRTPHSSRLTTIFATMSPLIPPATARWSSQIVHGGAGLPTMASISQPMQGPRGQQ
jgi:hypothetical protein